VTASRSHCGQDCVVGVAAEESAARGAVNSPARRSVNRTRLFNNSAFLHAVPITPTLSQSDGERGSPCRPAVKKVLIGLKTPARNKLYRHGQLLRQKRLPSLPLRRRVNSCSWIDEDLGDD